MTIRQDYQDRLGPWSDIQGHMPFLLEEAGKASQVIELGVRTGNSTVAFLAGLSGGGTLWSCDLDEPQVPAAWHDRPDWHFFRGDDLDPAVLAAMPASCDLLFIDTSHAFTRTLAELRAYMPRIRPGGTALFHDTQFAPPGTDLGQPIGQVARALDLYCAQNNLIWENRPGFYGLGVIRLGAP
jgi:predicted O-methyltransferase YrrM